MWELWDTILERPEQFIFIGTHGKIAAGGNRRKSKPAAFWIIYCPAREAAALMTQHCLPAQKANGASYNPTVLEALMNIFRIHYNWFEIRQYTGNTATRSGTMSVKAGMSSIRVPGTNETILRPKIRETAPAQRAPTQRSGVDPQVKRRQRLI